MSSARKYKGPTPSDPDDIATFAVPGGGGGGGNTVTNTYTGSSWPARSTLTVPSGGYVIYDSTGYPGAPEPTDYVDGDEWWYWAVDLPALGGKSVSWFQPIPNANTLTACVGVAVTAVGTATALAVTGSGATALTELNRVGFRVTSASSSAVAGFREANARWSVRNGFRFTMVAGPDTGNASKATMRFFMGLTSVTSAATDANPSGIADCLGLGCDSTDTTLQVMYRTGSGTVVKVDTGFAKGPTADSTDAYRLDMVVVPGGTTCSFIVTRLSDGSVFTHTSTTAIPASTTLLSPRGMRSVGGTSSVVGFALGGYYIESDN